MHTERAQPCVRDDEQPNSTVGLQWHTSALEGPLYREAPYEKVLD
jgi:hypothetical protein